MEGRFVYGQEVIFGTRSECDADDWTCTECNIINKSQQFLIFTIPAFTCTSCKKPFAGDFDFCLASVMANGLPLVDKVLCEKDGEGNCIAYAIVQSIGIIHRIHIALASNNGKLDIGLAKMPVEREVLIDAYSKKFPVEVGQVGGVHKLIHMCQDVVEHGVELKDKWWKRFFPSKYFNAVSKVAAIPCDDFEEVCRQIADGNPLIAVLMVGEKWENLKFCQFYKPISAVERALAGKFNINFVDHAIVLIGACSLGGHRAYYGLNSAGSLFCKQVGLNEDWKALSAAPGGFGKIKADSDFLINFLKLTRSGEDETHPVLKHEDETPVLSRENVAIVRGGEWSQRRKALINVSYVRI